MFPNDKTTNTFFLPISLGGRPFAPKYCTRYYSDAVQCCRAATHCLDRVQCCCGAARLQHCSQLQISIIVGIAAVLHIIQKYVITRIGYVNMVYIFCKIDGKLRDI